VAVVVQAISAAVVEAGVWASDGAELAQSCDAASLQGFGVIRDLSF
jgi:hypothetical protein